MLRVVGRDPRRSPDVFVERSSAEPITARAVPKPRVRAVEGAEAEESSPPSSAPSSTTAALAPLDEALETVHTGELILEEYSGDEAHTPVTPVAVWLRHIPPPLPEDG